MDQADRGGDQLGPGGVRHIYDSRSMCHIPSQSEELSRHEGKEISSLVMIKRKLQSRLPHVKIVGNYLL